MTKLIGKTLEVIAGTVFFSIFAGGLVEMLWPHMPMAGKVILTLAIGFSVGLKNVTWTPKAEKAV